MGSNIAFMFSFTYFFVDLLYQDKYGPINEDYMEKSPELIIAETLQTHLFAHSEFKKHLVQETLYSLAQNGSLTGLIHLLVLVLVVINRSMSGKSIHLSKISVVSVFACVWMFLIASHVMFSIMQMNAINNLDALFSNLAKGRTNLSCNASMESGYEEIASHCDRTAVFHAFGAYLLRGHTLFTILFLSASIIIFVITVTYHIKVRRQHDIIHSELRYHYARILAFIDPVMNPLIVILRTPALRRQLRSQWTTIRSRASSRTRSAHSHRETADAGVKYVNT
uniref:G_PROTEIN_RECEP_F1_2 domain-containing protein n=1 Tax=Caenorhabditis tropicalis TaxID=1561998 RepID=A0A1I7T1U2_9PELO